MLSGRLPETAATALDRRRRRRWTRCGCEVGRPVRPMLASPGSSLDAALADLGTDVTVEFKLDGARIQVHRDGDDVRVWTRTPARGHRRRARAGRAGARAAVPHRRARRRDPGPRRRRPAARLPGHDEPVRQRRRRRRGVLLSPFFFDLLHLDGRDLLDEPLRVRLDALAGLLADDEHAALRMPGVRAPRPRAGGRGAGRRARRRATRASSSRRWTRPTRPAGAARRGRRSSRCTPSTSSCSARSGATDGGSGKLSNIHLGARDPDGGEPVMVGKTFKGMTDELLDWQTRHLPRARPRAAADWGVRLRPELVVEIAVDGAQRSTRYPGGVALRFARVLRYRPDKTAGRGRHDRRRPRAARRRAEFPALGQASATRGATSVPSSSMPRSRSAWASRGLVICSETRSTPPSCSATRRSLVGDRVGVAHEEGAVRSAGRVELRPRRRREAALAGDLGEHLVPAGVDGVGRRLRCSRRRSRTRAARPAASPARGRPARRPGGRGRPAGRTGAARRR